MNLTVTTMKYDFKLKDFNEQNKCSVEQFLEEAQEKLRDIMSRPDFRFKRQLVQRVKTSIDSYEWYLEVYDTVVAEMAQSNVSCFPTSYFGED